MNLSKFNNIKDNLIAPEKKLSSLRNQSMVIDNNYSDVFGNTYMAVHSIYMTMFITRQDFGG